MNDSIMKADRRGRLRYSSEQKAAIVEAYQSSGLSGPRFAALHGVNYQTLASWLQKRKQACTPASAPSPRSVSLIPAVIEGLPMPGSDRRLEITLPCGARLSIESANQAQLAATLIRELLQARPC